MYRHIGVSAGSSCSSTTGGWVIRRLYGARLRIVDTTLRRPSRREVCAYGLSSRRDRTTPPGLNVWDGRQTSAAVNRIHSRTPILLKFCVALPSVEATGRWRERGRMGRRAR